MEATASPRIAASPEVVAAVMFDPRRDPEWIRGAKSVKSPSGDATSLGARVTRHGGFMGKTFSWEAEVEDFEPNSILHMHFIEGPMKGGSVTYRIEPDGQARAYRSPIADADRKSWLGS
jgi:hypothetical protein